MALEISRTMRPMIVFLLLLENSLGGGVHGLYFVVLGLTDGCESY